MNLIKDTIQRYQTIQNPEELEAAYHLVKEHRPQTVVELGTFRGGSLRVWTASADSEARIVGIDTPGTPQKVAEDLQGWLRPSQAGLIILGHTRAARTLRQTIEFIQAPIDFLFIDAEHQYEPVKGDWETWKPHLADNALVGFHDITHRPGVEHTAGVFKLWRELKEQYRTKELIAKENPYGIGMLWVG